MEKGWRQVINSVLHEISVYVCGEILKYELSQFSVYSYSIYESPIHR